MKTADCVLDTFAWVEYFNGSALGRQATPFIDGGRCLTPMIVVAELAVKYVRERNPRWEQEFRYLRARSAVAELTIEIAVGAGRVRELMRAAHAGVGLADAIIYETARSHNVPVLTGDPHFKGLPHVLFLE